MEIRTEVWSTGRSVACDLCGMQKGRIMEEKGTDLFVVSQSALKRERETKEAVNHV